ncbi:selection and upkeep of intraepithelial T-cells protein 3 isoform c precursor [Mus musculus]|uniref:Isoform 3 of Selection and upkeep of intraepithelial T-cells protein 3 n=1 Tax=Mus musculus TaxID=10090 RepID=A7TZF0-3|nr:selection and upkeep of intraepithelial T-cells protein 3 isoform c precursor [Mus musculus]ABS30718.1 skint 3 isoform c precursor [Mus musculus]|eukprot:XP_006502952.1 PREDICTED: selection and upkeep of intraepithelial T-cells protein 3 isoform X1 [Mus musculus]
MGSIQIIFAAYCVVLCVLQMLVLSSATSSDIKIIMHPPNIKGVMLECHSRGWFPQPHMEWRDSNGQVIPATSKSQSQDENKLFNMTMNLFADVGLHQIVTCYIQNLLTHQEESISIVLTGDLFSWKIDWILILSIIACVMIPYSMTSYLQQHLIHGSCSQRSHHWRKNAMVCMSSVIAIIGSMLILHLKQRVPISDQHFELDTLYLEDISVILCVVIVFNLKLNLLTYYRLERKYDGCTPGCKACFYILKIIIIILPFVFTFGCYNAIFLKYHQLQKKVSIPDPLYYFYTSWLVNMEMLGVFLVFFPTFINLIEFSQFIKTVPKPIWLCQENMREDDAIRHR